MRCSVIILNWNGEKWLRKFLPSVVATTKGEGIEVVVADNGSTDSSLQVLQEFPTVRVITFDQNHGFAEGYNRAINQIDAEYVVLLNSDVETTGEWLLPLLEYMDSHSDTAACQPKILSWRSKEAQDEHIQFEHAGAAGGYIDSLGYPYCRGRILGYAETDHGQYDTTTECFWATGACLLIRTNIYKECGGLDAGFFAHMEEIDLCWRLQCRGWKVACVTESVVYHVGGGALDYENPRKTYLNFRNNLLMLYKNLPASRLWWVMPVRFVLDYVAMMQALFTSKTQNAKAIIDARKDYHKMKADYKEKRNENMLLAKIAYPNSISKRSIIFDYYLLGKRK
ncbi:MAG: glycosyltransferase family 2 protein [Paludibacteraceae bacterium]|nr:glycosyltransferase family 2 protein [Paludibacteraceae bacterium]